MRISGIILIICFMFILKEVFVFISRDNSPPNYTTQIASTSTSTNTANVENDTYDHSLPTLSSDRSTDYVIVQYEGIAITNCWTLRGINVNYTQGTNGAQLWWNDSKHSNTIISVTGNFNYAEVGDGDFADAYTSLGVDGSECTNGRYGVQ